ncbi:hypothetical protein [Roseospira navarrensis]|uniref:Uncharacterized protein n=1 Tax=Roseospira navarrensis TaxID=140058 RepID=A0A7X1ZB67_9PROT|nr:hypothetical protein [Roseospira navarrensis]MQX35321.1 hypothetical protein [Roseospira navarrensis]
MRVLAAVLLLVPLVASCYVPDDFLVEVRINREGDFGLTYKGTLTWAPLWTDIAQGTLSEDEIAEKVENIRSDLVRYSGFKQVEHEGAGRFRVFYEATGHVEGDESYYFLRSNARVIAIISRADGLMIVRTHGITDDNKARLLAAGMDTRGKMRVATNANVLQHNAQDRQTGPGGFTYYDWTVRSVTDDAPRIVMAR